MSGGGGSSSDPPAHINTLLLFHFASPLNMMVSAAFGSENLPCFMQLNVISFMLCYKLYIANVFVSFIFLCVRPFTCYLSDLLCVHVPFVLLRPCPPPPSSSPAPPLPFALLFRVVISESRLADVVQVWRADADGEAPWLRAFGEKASCFPAAHSDIPARSMLRSNLPCCWKRRI